MKSALFVAALIFFAAVVVSAAAPAKAAAKAAKAAKTAKVAKPAAAVVAASKASSKTIRWGQFRVERLKDKLAEDQADLAEAKRELAAAKTFAKKSLVESR